MGDASLGLYSTTQAMLQAEPSTQQEGAHAHAHAQSHGQSHAHASATGADAYDRAYDRTGSVERSVEREMHLHGTLMEGEREALRTDLRNKVAF